MNQPYGLRPFNPTTAPAATDPNLLPPIGTFGETPLPGTDTTGSSSFNVNNSFLVAPINQRQVWEDDLLLTGVRSFDVKAYDMNAPLYNTLANGYFSAGYQDLGYGSTQYELTGSPANSNGSVNYVSGPNGSAGVSATTTPGVVAPITVVTPLYATAPWQGAGAEPVGFGHEGRIPPLTTDYRIHPRRPYLVDPNGNSYPYNIGDDGLGIIRLTRVWDSWSTDYTTAPDTDFNLTNASSTVQAVYPSFPPPYPSPLRGIQIQIRMTDARGERTKSITIRHDFTDKLN